MKEPRQKEESKKMIHAAKEVRVVLRYLHAASSEYAMRCKKRNKRTRLSKEQRDRDLRDRDRSNYPEKNETHRKNTQTGS